MSQKTQIIFLNQSAGPLFRELVTNAADKIGPVIFLNSDSPTPNQPHIRMLKAPKCKNKSPFSRIKSWISYLMIAAWHVAFCPGKPLLFIVTNPPIMPLIGWIMRIIKKQRYVLLYYDIYPEAVIRFRGLSEGSLLTKLWRLVNRMAISSADLVVTISNRMAETLSQYFPKREPQPNLLVIPTWVDTGWIKPISFESNPFAQRYGHLDNLIVLYSGNLGAVHDLSMLPSMAGRLSQYPRIRFLIVSSSPRRIDLEAQCQDLKLDNVVFLPQQPEEFLPQVLATGDIGIVSLAVGAEGISMPSKTYYMMAAGNALLGISSPNSELDRLIGEHKCGRNIVPDNVDDAVMTILHWYEDRDALFQTKQRSRAAAQAHFDKGVLIPKVLSELSRFIAKRVV
jgi:glycosyltransferase involved in cell wall biosynthesis